MNDDDNLTLDDLERMAAALRKLPAGILIPGFSRAELLRLNAFARVLLEETGARTIGEARAVAAAASKAHALTAEIHNTRNGAETPKKSREHAVN